MSNLVGHMSSQDGFSEILIFPKSRDRPARGIMWQLLPQGEIKASLRLLLALFFVGI